MTKKSKKQKTKHKKKLIIPKNIKVSIIIVCILIIILTIFNKKEKNQEIILIMDNEDVTSQLSHSLFNFDTIIYMSYDDIAKYIDKTIYIEDKNTIITTSNKKVACLQIENSKIIINGSEKECNSEPIVINEVIYLPISEMQSVYDLDFFFSEKSNRFIIEDLTKSKEVTTIKNNSSIKIDKSFFSKTLCKVKKGDKVAFIKAEERWAKVRNEDGYIGYININKIQDIINEREELINEIKVDGIDYLEKDISKEDISSFEKRQSLIQNIFNEAIKKEKMGIKMKCNKTDEKNKRLEIEAKPFFNECGLDCEFIYL